MILDKFNLSGKVALVTGSNRGIGQMYAKALAEAGADIIGVSYECDFNSTEKIITALGGILNHIVQISQIGNQFISLFKMLKMIMSELIY